jgi:large subunit ribosomal protein L15
MKLNQISDNPGATKDRMRVGRGIGSGKGKTAGRGVKGQKARTGVSIKGFEGGQMPLHRRLPKRGFTSPAQKHDAVAEVRTSELDAMQATEIDLAALKAEKVVPHGALEAKVILSGELKRKITLKEIRVSKGARALIEKAGGKIELTEKPVVEKKKKEKKPKKAEAAEGAEKA